MGILFSKAAAKSINKMDSTTKARIRKAIDAIPDGDIVSMKGCEGSYRLRVGGWRVLFSYPENGTILVEKIAPRGQVYKE